MRKANIIDDTMAPRAHYKYNGAECDTGICPSPVSWGQSKSALNELEKALCLQNALRDLEVGEPFSPLRDPGFRTMAVF